MTPSRSRFKCQYLSDSWSHETYLRVCEISPASRQSLRAPSLSRCNEEFTRRAVNSSHIRRDPVGVKSGCPGGCSRAPQGPPETYGRLPLWRVGCGESCGGRTGSDVARTAHGGVPRHKRPFGSEAADEPRRGTWERCRSSPGGHWTFPSDFAVHDLAGRAHSDSTGHGG